MTVQKDTSVVEANFGEVIGEKYLAYALSTIMSRSLPDVRDGLKPVHRRLLYAMLQLKLNPENAFKKCARVVGDVIGKYHPHGDGAVYDTLVRLAQSFSLRYPLVDGQGNFGSIDGDNAAAMRYTESRLTSLAMHLMLDIEKDTVDFKPTYDDSDSEPGLMPAAFPNLLANGSEGIAVGMATSIPPHNLEELCGASIYLIDHPKATIKDLLKFVEGPDFPTGGVVVDTPENIENIYTTGRGSLKVRAAWEIEQFGHGLYQIIITEIPYQVQKSRVIENIANLLRDKKTPFINNIRDESTDQIRIVIEPKNRSCDPKMIMESLFKQTELESRFNYNLNVINGKGLPEVLNLVQILQEFLNHRFIIVTRRSQFDLTKIENRLEILEGLKIVYLNLDEIIRIIRDEDEPKPVLKAKFNLTDNQAEAILNTRLRSLRKLEEQGIQAEYNELKEKQQNLLAILGDASKCWSVVKNEIKTLQKEFSKKTLLGQRRTKFTLPEETSIELKLEAFIEKEAVTVICSKQGWIRSVKGNIDDLDSLKFKEGDELKLAFKAYTTDYIVVVTSAGRCYSILVDNISKGKGHGEPLRLMIDITAEDEIINIFVYNSEQNLFLVSSHGRGFIVSQSEIVSQTKLGKQVMNLPEGQNCFKALILGETDNMVACMGSNRKLLVFAVEEIPNLKRGQGVTLQKLKDAQLADIELFNSEEGFKWSNSKETKIQKNFTPWLGKRGGSGKLPPFGFLKNNKFE